MTASGLKWARLAAGYYESNAGHEIRQIGRAWYITWPEQVTPDVARDTLREAQAYVDTDPRG